MDARGKRDSIRVSVAGKSASWKRGTDVSYHRLGRRSTSSVSGGLSASFENFLPKLKSLLISDC
jgi:hypothetical protein